MQELLLYTPLSLYHKSIYSLPFSLNLMPGDSFL